ncbi:hypothetical protein EDI_236800 [Entamoeba dispar SAW760]|uniref:Uncharacterized protein n=1 Tax=Entamoeba dispar (strain ATCC PRA-260 / SAW760) TaxID=370354 RepID=B0EU57_ENTDS|nr:uncharacterized protein EDI_236800 [Entamoeba dispar SAW760]EDR21936.1 hypothetical protein EDI_236800 [Entamoeba dispar SAW760]|eukprot:EDR21936.1 hypothetical protein EDI_236800 [Entamoeba dispar SAW760]
MSENTLFIERQTSVMTEMVKGEEILVVVKQCNFVLTVTSNTKVLEGAEICCELLYDSPELKPVSFINQPPIKYKALQASEHSLNVECKLNVLSSQHEDHFFRVKVTVLLEGKNIGDVLSSPIRSISKLDPHKKELIKKKKSEAHIVIHSTEKKPKTLTYLEENKNNKSFTLTNLLTILSQNTALLEQIKQKQSNEDDLSSLENGFLCFIDRYNQSGRRKNLIIDAIARLNDTSLQGLDEIANVVEATLPDERRRTSTEYDYPYSLRNTQRDYQLPSFAPPPVKPFINYTNPFLR